VCFCVRFLGVRGISRVLLEGGVKCFKGFEGYDDELGFEVASAKCYCSQAPVRLYESCRGCWLECP
jgi:hypothetical protein